MTETVNVDVQRTGFPVTIGGIPLWFDTSDERLANFYDIEAKAQERLVEFEKQIVSSGIANDTDEEKGVTKETLKGAIKLEAKLLEIQYDLLFGDGTFAKLYQEFPDHQALNAALEQVAALIEKKLQELAVEREKAGKERAKQYATKDKVAKQKK